jgi:hypothetical protein
LFGAALHTGVVIGLLRTGRRGSAAAWAIAVGGVYPLLNSTRNSMASIVRRIERRVTESVVVDLDDRAAAPAEAAGHRFVTSRVEDFDDDRASM